MPSSGSVCCGHQRGQLGEARWGVGVGGGGGGGGVSDRTQALKFFLSISESLCSHSSHLDMDSAALTCYCLLPPFPPSPLTLSLAVAHINERAVCNAIAPEKDVDGFHIVNIGKLCLDQRSMIPATPAAVWEIIKRAGKCSHMAGICWVFFTFMPYTRMQRCIE